MQVKLSKIQVQTLLSIVWVRQAYLAKSEKPDVTKIKELELIANELAKALAATE